MNTPMIAMSTPIAGDDQREDQAVLAERRLAQDQRGDQRHRVRLEQVGGHAGAVADVVAHVVGDGRGVARVVLGDALLDLADQVGADVGGLGEDAAADPHEHREQRGAEAEALEHGRGVALVDQHDQRGTEQAEADGEEADHAAGAERDLHRLLAAAVARAAAAATRRLARVASAMPAPPMNALNTAPTTKNSRPADLDRGLVVAGVVHRQQEQQHDRDDDEDAERLELAEQVRRGALLHGAGDLLHLGGAPTRRRAPP